MERKPAGVAIVFATTLLMAGCTAASTSGPSTQAPASGSSSSSSSAPSSSGSSSSGSSSPAPPSSASSSSASASASASSSSAPPSGSVAPPENLTGSDGEALEQQINDVGIAADPGSLTCDDTAVAAGATIGCELTANGAPVGLDVEVKKVDGSKAELEVAATPQPVPAAVVAANIKPRIGAQIGAELTGSTCESDLAPEVGKSVTCTVSLDAQNLRVTVTVTAVTGGQMDYRIDKAS